MIKIYILILEFINKKKFKKIFKKQFIKYQIHYHYHQFFFLSFKKLNYYYYNLNY